MRRTVTFVTLPVLDRKWLERWRHDYGISFRMPTKRYKVKRDVLRCRLRSMWMTNIRIRALRKFCLGVGLPINGFDQKGIYMNEAGSKDDPLTVHLRGTLIHLRGTVIHLQST